MLCEKPVGVSVEEVEELAAAVKASGRILQVGHMKRFDPGLEAARDFVRDEIGEVLALKAWYCDSTHRYTMTDAVQPLPIASAGAKKPRENPKADLRRYFMLAHGSHLVDTARFLCGDLVEVSARLTEKFGAYCWFVDVAFANGAMGHLDLTVAVRMDWHEGLQLYGENGSVIAKTYNPWYYKSSDVEIFSEKDATTRRVLGADGHFYRRQLEGFADTILDGAPMRGADIADGVASVRAMAAIARIGSQRPRRCASPMCKGRSDADRHLCQDLFRHRRTARAQRCHATPATTWRSSTWPVSAAPPCPIRSRRPLPTRSPRRAARLAWRLPRSPAPTT